MGGNVSNDPAGLGNHSALATRFFPDEAFLIPHTAAGGLLRGVLGVKCLGSKGQVQHPAHGCRWGVSPKFDVVQVGAGRSPPQGLMLFRSGLGVQHPAHGCRLGVSPKA